MLYIILACDYNLTVAVLFQAFLAVSKIISN